MNTPNKVFRWLDIHLDLTIGEKTHRSLPYSLKEDNYMSFIIAKSPQFQRISLSSGDPVHRVVLELYSNKLNLKMSLPQAVDTRSVKANCVKGKVFNVALMGNLVLVFFDGDKTLSYALIEISITSILLEFLNMSEVLQARLMRDAPRTLKVLLQKQLKPSYGMMYSNIDSFLRDMTDFELFVSLHNGKERLCYFLDTMAVPKYFQSNELSKQALVFEYEGMREPMHSMNFSLHFSNELGIQEVIEGLVFLEIVVKDRQKIRYVKSGVQASIKVQHTNEFGFGYSSG